MLNLNRGWGFCQGADMSILIIGAGLSGLSAAFYLERLGYRPIVIEKSNRVGGRVVTDKVKGFLLDRGFQVVLSNYKALFDIVDFKDLRLKAFPQAALLRSFDNEKLISSPFSFPFSFKSLKSKDLISFGKLGALVLKSKAGLLKKELLFSKTQSALSELSLDPNFLNGFLVPFFRGVFLSDALEIPLHRFLTLLKYFAFGRAYLPEEGIEAIPQGIKRNLSNTEFLLNSGVKAIDGSWVILEKGAVLKSQAIVFAIDYPSIRLIYPHLPCRESCKATYFYLSMPKNKTGAPKPFLYLDGSPASPINNFSFPDLIQSSYAPEDYHLISVTVISKSWQKEPDLEFFVKAEIARRLKLDERVLKVLSAYNILHALPSQKEGPPDLKHLEDQIPMAFAGELSSLPSIQEAVLSGKNAAYEIHNKLIK